MIPTSSFTIYNASAGAGKTYTLVKSYLITILKAEFKDSFKNVLALTFTNKAVAEMKTRVLENLVALSLLETPEKLKHLLKELSEATQLSEAQLKNKAQKILKSILHNYAGFDIVTIDTFTHRIIRTFAYDLGIPINFEIEMDTESLIEEAVMEVVNKVGIDENITKVIIDFALSKIEDDKSWDITLELQKTAKLLYSENDREHINKLASKELNDFNSLKTLLQEKHILFKKEVIQESQEILNTFENLGLNHKDFMRGAIPNHFNKIANGDIKVDFGAAWKQQIETTDFYSKSLEQNKKELIDGIRLQIESVFKQTKEKIQEISLHQNIIQNLIPLSVLNLINKELIKLKKDRKLLLISEFNTLISNAIKDQPAPFIYERLGERYRDYFIDEFQDTSELQWTNLIPLIDNALSTETLSGKRGKLTIVGDAKQAIYRWRGGKAEQLIDLSNNINPFSTNDKNINTLPKNYRSHENVIQFNNEFFSFIAKDFTNPAHKNLYIEGNQQAYNTKANGYVNISFIQASSSVEEQEIYPKKTHEIICSLLEKGYELQDICILVRRQKEGISIANYLTEQGISIISSETLLINNDPEVRFVCNILTTLAHEKDLLARIDVLHFLAKKLEIKNKDAFLELCKAANSSKFYKTIEGYGYKFHPLSIKSKTLYSCVISIIQSFELNHNSAYLQFFLDVVFSYTQKNNQGIHGFLTYWHQKKENLSIISPEDDNAVQIMTIHKSKGLEFPCVIYPFANTDIYKELEPKTWLSVPSESYQGFNKLLINYNKGIADYNSKTKEIVSDRNAQLELDNINLLYVACTRASEQLYIVSKLDISTKGVPNTNKFSGKLIQFLQYKELWNEQISSYEFGVNKKPHTSSKKPTAKRNYSFSELSSSKENHRIHIVTNSGKLWDTHQQEAIERGNLIHDLLSKIHTVKDISSTVENAFLKGEIGFEQKKLLTEQLNEVVHHPVLHTYFTKAYNILNEREIVCNNQLYRPDRLLLKENQAILIDYKTGDYHKKHEDQLNRYADVLTQMNYNVTTKTLVYINEKIELKPV